MKYFYERPHNYIAMFGEVVSVSHPLFTNATLYFSKGKGVLVVVQEFDYESKAITWSSLPPYLANDIYLNEHFPGFFRANATSGDYPIFTARQLMWALRMKPLHRETWETWKGDEIIGWTD